MISTIAHSYEHNNTNPLYTVDSFTSKLSFLFLNHYGIGLCIQRTWTLLPKI